MHYQKTVAVRYQHHYSSRMSHASSQPRKWKRIVGREYLFLLGFVFLGIASIAIGGLLKPLPPDYPTRQLLVECGYSEIEADSLESISSAYDADPSAVPVHEKRYLLTALRSVKSRREVKQREYSERATNTILWCALVFPYPLFLFVRTIIWSIRQVRSKPSK